MSGIIKPCFGVQLKRDHPLARGLTGCWLMNEGSGNQLYDSSGNGNDGTLTNGPLWVAGINGSAISFDGSDDYVATSPPLPFSTGATISFRLKIPTLTSHRGLVDWGARTHDPGIYIHYVNGSNISIYFVPESWAKGTVGPVSVLDVMNGPWSMWTFTLDGTNIICYKNGIAVANSTYTSIDQTILKIGYSYQPGNYYNGIMSDFMIYSRALSAQEVSELYAFPYCMFKESTYPTWILPTAPAGGLLIPPGLLFSRLQGVL